MRNDNQPSTTYLKQRARSSDYFARSVQHPLHAACCRSRSRCSFFFCIFTFRCNCCRWCHYCSDYMWALRTHLVNSLIFHLLHWVSFASDWIHKPHQNNYRSKWRKIYDDFFLFSSWRSFQCNMLWSVVRMDRCQHAFLHFHHWIRTPYGEYSHDYKRRTIVVPKYVGSHSSQFVQWFVSKFEIKFKKLRDLCYYFVCVWDASLRLTVDFSTVRKMDKCGWLKWQINTDVIIA